LTFWRWFFKGSGGSPGVGKFANRWLLLHVAIGIAMAAIVPVNLEEAANAVLLPLAGIFIGLSFAWGGNAQALLQTDEIDRLASYHKGGFENYLYTFQSAMLVILGTLVLWGLAGLKIFDVLWPGGESAQYWAIETMLYGAASLTMRECWHVVLGAQALLLLRRRIQHEVKASKQPDNLAETQVSREPTRQTLP
jgi:hypothetical protein